MNRPEPSDAALLESFFRNQEEAAFTEIVRRHLPLVYAIAQRLTGNATLAQDASQIVFIKLARVRRPFPAALPLVAWLHTTSRSAAIDIIRSESRRQKREQTAAENLPMKSSENFLWQEISPLLDELIGKLRPREQAIILGRYFQAKSYRDIAESLQLSEDGARMSGKRALDRLRILLGRRGIVTTSSLLGTALQSFASAPAAAGLATQISASAISAASVGTASSLLPTLIIMSYKTHIIIGSALVLAGAALLAVRSGTDSSNASASQNAGLSISSAGLGASSSLENTKASRIRPGNESKPGETKAGGEAREATRRQLEKDQTIDSRLLALKTRLNLTPQQEAAVRAAYEQANRQRDGLRAAEAVRRRDGTETAQTRQADREAFAQIRASESLSVNAALDEGQQTAYEEYQADAIRAQANTWANQQLGSITAMLDLNETQQGQVFDLLTQQVQSFDPNPTLDQGGSPIKAFDEQSMNALPATLQSMQQILTPAQFQLFQSQMEQRAAALQK